MLKIITFVGEISKNVILWIYLKELKREEEI